jgi:hypothetical protein
MTADSPLECSDWVAVTFWEEENQNHLWLTFVGWFEVTDMSQFSVSLSCEDFYFLLNDVHTLWRKLLKYCRKSDCCYFSYTSLWDWVWVLCNNVFLGRKFHIFSTWNNEFYTCKGFLWKKCPYPLSSIFERIEIAPQIPTLWFAFYWGSHSKIKTALLHMHKPQTDSQSPTNCLLDYFLV